MGGPRGGWDTKSTTEMAADTQVVADLVCVPKSGHIKQKVTSSEVTGSTTTARGGHFSMDYIERLKEAYCFCTGLSPSGYSFR